MFKIDWAPRTKQDFRRLKAFLARKNPTTARKIRPTILDGVLALVDNPALGTQLEGDRLERRIWRIPFGQGQYILYYALDHERKAIQILRIWHNREDRNEAS